MQENAQKYFKSLTSHQNSLSSFAFYNNLQCSVLSNVLTSQFLRSKLARSKEMSLMKFLHFTPGYSIENEYHLLTGAIFSHPAMHDVPVGQG